MSRRHCATSTIRSCQPDACGRRLHLASIASAAGWLRVDEHSRRCSRGTTRAAAPAVCRPSSATWKTDAGDIAARPARLATRPSPTGSAACGEDDRNGRGRGLGASAAMPVAADHGDRRSHQFGRQRRQPIVLAVRPAVFDRHVLAVDIAGLAQTLPERGYKMRIADAGRPAAEQADHRHRRLLRARRRAATAAAPPSSVMNSRRCSGRDVRFIARPPPRTVRAAFPHTAPTSGV